MSFFKFCGDHDLENLGKLEPPPAAPQRRESAVVGEQLPMIGFVQGICMCLAGTSGTSSTAWDNFRPTKKNNFSVSGTRFFLHKISLSCVAGTLFLIHKRLSLSKWIPLSSHSPSIDQAFLQFHPAFTGRPKFFETRPPAIDTAGWRCRIRPQSRDRLGTRQLWWVF